MRVVVLSRLLAVLLWRLWIAASLTTYAPGAEEFGRRRHLLAGVMAILGTIGAAVISRLPPGHWMHRSTPVWWLTVIAAALVASGEGIDFW